MALSVGADGVREAREELAAILAEARRAGASSSSTPPSKTASPTSASSERTTPQGSAPSARCACRWAPGRARGARARLAYNGFAPVLPPRRPVGDVVRAWSSARSSSRSRSSCSTRSSTARSSRPPRTRQRAEPDRPPESPRGATSCIVERDGTGSHGAGSAPAPTQTGPWSPSQPPTTCSPTSRSSTRASSSATPAPTADAHPPRDLRRLRRASTSLLRTTGAASPSAASTPAPATAASTSSRSPSPYYDLQRYGLGIVASPAMPTCSSSPAPSPHACTSRSSPPTTRCPSRAASPLGDCALGCNLLGHTSELVGHGDGAPSTSASPAAAHTRDRRGAPPPDRRLRSGVALRVTTTWPWCGRTAVASLVNRQRLRAGMATGAHQTERTLTVRNVRCATAGVDGGRLRGLLRARRPRGGDPRGVREERREERVVVAQQLCGVGAAGRAVTSHSTSSATVAA